MIIKRSHKVNFTTISNVPIRQETLSAEALAVLLYLYSQPPDWRVTHKDLMRRFRFGRDKTFAVLGELKAHGYIVKRMMRTPEGRILGCEFIVDDEPRQKAVA